MIRVFLNVVKGDNYAFFDPESRTHLTLTSPMATIDRLTACIYRDILSGSIIDIDETSGIEVSERVATMRKTVLNKFQIKVIPKKLTEESIQEPKAEQQKVQELEVKVEETVSAPIPERVVAVEVPETVKPKGKSKSKKAAEAVDEVK